MAKDTTDTTTITAGQVSTPVVEKQGEIAVDKGATAPGLKEQSRQERLDEAKAQALANHAHEHEGDDEPYETLIQNDKPDDQSDGSEDSKEEQA